MQPYGRCGMNECESCIHYPPSAADGKPCCFCDPIDPMLNFYQRKERDELETCQTIPEVAQKTRNQEDMQSKQL